MFACACIVIIDTFEDLKTCLLNFSWALRLTHLKCDAFRGGVMLVNMVNMVNVVGAMGKGIALAEQEKCIWRVFVQALNSRIMLFV